jgi:hypothetical protein
VIDEDGNEIRAIVSDTNVIESRVCRKQFPSGKEARLSLKFDRPTLADVDDMMHNSAATITDIEEHLR